jgi:hypothetical protein
MARVNVEQQALSDQSDPRYKILARELGVDRWSALGRMCVVWNICQERETYVLELGIVNSLFDDAPCLSEALVKSGLGKKHRYGVYISGSRGRVEWLANKRLTGRTNGKRGGRPKKTKEEPIENQHGLRAETPPALAPALALTEEKPQTKKARSAEQLVEEFAVTDDLRRWAVEHTPSLDVESQTRRWRDRLRANGYKSNAGPVKDAAASWRYWMETAAEINARKTNARNDNRRPERKTPVTLV